MEYLDEGGDGGEDRTIHGAEHHSSTAAVGEVGPIEGVSNPKIGQK